MAPRPTPLSESPPGLPTATLEALIERYRGALVGLFAAWGSGNPTDMAQDVLAEAWVGRARFEGDWDDDGSVGPWLRGIARNLHRSAGRQRVRFERLDEDFDPPASAESEQREARAARVRAAIATLPEELRVPVFMHYLERTPQRVIAGLLGLGEKTVEGRLYRARRELASKLEEERPMSARVEERASRKEQDRG
ncbi:MAG: RNA polymerase sigma factor [Planctomycetota bacterium]|jgi:RNA polymerase sigma-70 factor (ECF subfamily)